MSSSARKKCDGCEAYLEPNDFHVHGGDKLALIAEVQSLRETVSRLNRRCQDAESAARVKVEEVQKAGPSLGRALAGWAAEDRQRKLEEAIKERDSALLQVSALEAALHKIACAECSVHDDQCERHRFYEPMDYCACDARVAGEQLHGYKCPVMETPKDVPVISIRGGHMPASMENRSGPSQKEGA